MSKWLQALIWFGKITFGCLLFGVGFSVFLEPNDLNAGGISGIAMMFVHLSKLGSVGVVTMLINLPLFVLGGIKVGKKFFIGSLFGLVASSLFLDLCTLLPQTPTEPLLAALYGGVLCGLGLGIVFSCGASTGGSDIIVRLLKFKYENAPIGTINICFDAAVVILTGLVFWDVSKALYSGITIFVCGQVIDAVVYRFDYSKVAIIISKNHEQIAKRIGDKLDRGATFLDAEGSFSGCQMKVVLTVVKKQQVAELKKLVLDIDAEAFVVVQEAHQVLGEGFSHYSKESL